jgi:hypothetical protein
MRPNGFLIGKYFFIIMVIISTNALAVQFTGLKTGAGEWTYTLTYDPGDNYNRCDQTETTITLSGLIGVTQAFAPTSTDYPDGGIDNLDWTPQVLNGGTTVVWTIVEHGSGNWGVARHIYGFRVLAPSSDSGTVSVATDGFAPDEECPVEDLDIQTTTVGPASAGHSSIPTLSEWGIIIMSLMLAGAAIWMIRRRQIA